jgi:glycosyltransferase involved in cell wall biosynthesis
MSTSVTILLPVFNGEDYLPEAIDSILRQTHEDFEFLIIDDGSTDRSLEIIRGYEDPRIRILINSDRLKLSGALNRGLDEAKGTFIARMDADDIALPDRLRKQVDFLNHNAEVGLCGTSIRVFGQARERNDIYPKSTEDIRSYALFDCPFCHPTVMFRREWFASHLLRYSGCYYPTEDFELWSRAIEQFPSVNLEEVLLRYRIHEKSMTGADWDEMDRQAARVIEPRLRQLELSFSEEELKFHRHIGRGRSVCLQSLGEIDRAEVWLSQLLKKNQLLKSYNERALLEVVRTVWFRVCMNSSQLGFALVERFRKSSLAAGPMYYSRLLALIGSTVKHCLKG